MRVRKQVYELTVDDLSANPVWEFALDEEGEEDQDEATVRPRASAGVLDPDDGMFIVHARFILADGTQLQGYLTPPVQGETGLGTHQPAIVTSRGQVSFWCGTIEPQRVQLDQLYGQLGKTDPNQVFPISFESTVPMTCGKVQGEIPGFMVLEDFRTLKSKVIL